MLRHPMAVTPGFRDFVLDQLEPLGLVAARPMFGGVGLYRDQVFFGILAGDVLYLKVDETSRSKYETAGMSPFKPYPARPATMQYYAVPLKILEDSEVLVRWARQAVRVAERVTQLSPKRRVGRRKTR